jgi:glycosyltransferase involved in cell wall biosynthesis
MGRIGQGSRRTLERRATVLRETRFTVSGLRIAVLGHNDWWAWDRQGHCGRNAALVRALSSRQEVSSIAVVDTPRPLGRGARPGAARKDGVTTVGPSISAVRHGYPLPLPSRWSWGRRVNDVLSRPALCSRLRSALPGRGPAVVWVADPRLVSEGLRIGGDVHLFDAIDDWRHYEWVGRKAVEAGYAEAGRSYDIVTAVNPSLLELIRPRRLARFVPNALAWSEWTELKPDAESLARFRRPVIGYVGTLEERVDAALVCDVARLMPDASFVLFGPVLRGFDLPAEAPQNVHLGGPLARPAVPHVLSAFDACMLPHRRGGIVETMDPLKIYEYLAAGRPVISTAPSPNPRLASEITVAADAESFAMALRGSLESETDESSARRRAVVSAETWAARVQDYLGLISVALQGKRPRMPGADRHTR